MTRPLFLGEPGSLDDAVRGRHVRLDGPEARHAAQVRRVRVGEAVDVADGAGRVVTGDVVAVAPETMTVEVASATREHAPEVHLVLVQALAKADRDERGIEAATEVGVDAVVPWQAGRSVVVWDERRRERGERRWEAVVRAAAKQSRRSRVPEVRPFLRGAEVVDCVGAASAAGSVVVVLHEGATVPLAHVALPRSGEVLVVVGPEGGLAPGELDALTAAGAVAARLGPHVLRTSTAGPVALALLAERLGRWDVARARLPG